MEYNRLYELLRELVMLLAKHHVDTQTFGTSEGMSHEVKHFRRVYAEAQRLSWDVPRETPDAPPVADAPAARQLPSIHSGEPQANLGPAEVAPAPKATYPVHNPPVETVRPPEAPPKPSPDRPVADHQGKSKPEPVKVEKHKATAEKG